MHEVAFDQQVAIGFCFIKEQAGTNGKNGNMRDNTDMIIFRNGCQFLL
jgi:hypothetical protein